MVERSHCVKEVGYTGGALFNSVFGMCEVAGGVADTDDNALLLQGARGIVSALELRRKGYDGDPVELSAVALLERCCPAREVPDEVLGVRALFHRVYKGALEVGPEHRRAVCATVLRSELCRGRSVVG